MKKIRSYTELMKLKTFEERFEYLKLNGNVGEETFGFDRYLNQKFYSSDIEWKKVRNLVIVRDNGCDLGCVDRQIRGPIIVHHINPITKDDLINRTDVLLNPEYLICTYKKTHDAIHYGDSTYPKTTSLTTRTKNDTCPWKKG